MTVFSRFLHASIAFSLLLTASSSAFPKTRKTNNRPPSRTEFKEAQRRLSKMGFGTSQNAVVTFQKWADLKITGRLTRKDLNAILETEGPKPKDAGYRHVEVDLDRQVLIMTNDDGDVTRVLPVSTGSGKRYKEKNIRGLAYTPRGRFRIYGKMSGWRKSPLGLLYYPNYFSDGLAIHGNPSVPHSPQSHGCIRIPMSAAKEMSRLLPVGTIVLIYDSDSFVSAKDWAEADKEKQASNIR